MAAISVQSAAHPMPDLDLSPLKEAQLRGLNRINPEERERVAIVAFSSLAINQALGKSEAGQRADEAAARLGVHTQTGRRFRENLKAALQRFLGEYPISFKAFARHKNECAVLATTCVRFYASLCWFKHVPQYLYIVLRTCARHYQESCKLRANLNVYKRMSGNQPTPLSVEEELAAAGVMVDDNGDVRIHTYGLEPDHRMHSQTLGLYNPPSFSSDVEAAAWLRAVFNTRRIRLEHERSPEMRFPAKTPFEDSLDHSVYKFLKDLVADYYDTRTRRFTKKTSEELSSIIEEIQLYVEQTESRRNQIIEFQQKIKAKNEKKDEFLAKKNNPRTHKKTLPKLDKDIEKKVEELDFFQALLDDITSWSMPPNPCDDPPQAFRDACEINTSSPEEVQDITSGD